MDRWWKREYDFLFRVVFLRIKILLLQGNFPKMESLIRESLLNIPLPEKKLDYAKICHLLVIQKTMQGLYGDAVTEGRKVLNMLLDDRHSLPQLSSDMPFESLFVTRAELVTLNEYMMEKVCTDKCVNVRLCVSERVCVCERVCVRVCV